MRILDLRGEHPRALQKAVADGLAARRLYTPEGRAYRPHATVARLRAGARAPRAAGLGDPAPVAFAGEAVTLYRSHLSRAGASYEPLERIQVG